MVQLLLAIAGAQWHTSKLISLLLDWGVAIVQTVAATEMSLENREGLLLLLPSIVHKSSIAAVDSDLMPPIPPAAPSMPYRIQNTDLIPPIPPAAPSMPYRIQNTYVL